LASILFPGRRICHGSSQASTNAAAREQPDVAHLAELGELEQRFGAAYPPGKRVFSQGEPGSELFVVLGGAVEFVVLDPIGAHHALGRAGPGDLFGEMSCFSGEPRSATATAIEPTRLLRFDRKVALELVRTRPEFGLLIVRTLAARLRRHVQSEGPA
jgi:CRP-like cAMP-binding protein